MIRKTDLQTDWKYVGILLTVFLLSLGFAAGLAAAPKCDSPPCKDDGEGGFETRDLPANAVFLESDFYAVLSDGLETSDPYIDGEERVSCKIGRRDGQFGLTTSNKATSGRMLCLDDHGQIDASAPCGDFSGCRVSQMVTARIKYGGADLRFLQNEVEIPLWINFHDNKQNLWHVKYQSVRVKPLHFIDGKPTAWNIDTSCVGCSIADVSRIIDNQFADPIECGLFDFPFHVTVDLQ